jgi:protein ImuB
MLWLALAPPVPCSPASASETAAPSGEPDWLACAYWAGRYTPRVSLDLAAPVLRLEIAASLRLFGGLSALLDAVRADLLSWPWPLNLALATTPRAAHWLARASDGVLCASPAQTLSGLRALPLSALPLPPEVAQRLQMFGLRRLGEVIDLPRAALALRVGKVFVLDLARALGEIDEPLLWFDFPELFVHALELPAPVDNAPALLFAARRLIRALCGWLAARNAATGELLWQLDHGKSEVSTLPLRFSVPVHAEARIERVLSQALANFTLKKPVQILRLQVDRVEPRDARTQVLFDGSDASAGGDLFHDLLDRLSARLGADALRRVHWQADHRPEAANHYAAFSPPATGRTSGSLGYWDAAGFPALQRPLRLFDPPQRLIERNGAPWLNGPLSLCSSPERIESGWWDDADARRDYFVALDVNQRCLWLYRSCRAPVAWYVHGEFV